MTEEEQESGRTYTQFSSPADEGNKYIINSSDIRQEELNEHLDKILIGKI